jgi:hypothetical protein
MSAQNLFESSARDEALMTISRDRAAHQGQTEINTDISRWSADFGAGATLRTQREANGPTTILIGSNGENVVIYGNALAGRKASDAELRSFDAIFPNIVRDLREQGAVEDLAGERIADLLEPNAPRTAFANGLEQTTLARPASFYIDRYVTPAIARSNAAHTAAATQAIDQAHASSGIVRLEKEDADRLPADMRRITLMNDDSVFAANDGTSAMSLLRAGAANVAYIDARGDVAQLATLSTMQSAKLLTSIDSDRTLDQWEKTLTSDHAPEQSRETRTLNTDAHSR